MLTVCTSSTTDQLTGLATVKEELGIVDTKDDELLNRLIRSASAWAESVVGRPLLLQTYQETVAGKGGRNLALSRYPIRRVLRLFDATGTSGASELLSSQYRVEDEDAGLLSRDAGWSWNVAGAGVGPAGYGAGIQPTDPDASFGDRQPWLAEYSAGFVGPGGTTSTGDGSTSTGRTLPWDVEQAVILRAKRLFLRAQLDPGVESRRIGDLAVTYRSAQAGPEPEALLLEPYRRVA